MTSSQTEPLVILGAGPAGLACAHKLLSLNPDRQVLIVDRAATPGGLGSSFEWNSHVLDFGPHAFHTRGGEPEALVKALFADDPGQLIQGRKQVKIYLKGKLFKYPLQINEALLKFNPFISLLIVAEFASTSLLHAVLSIPVVSFKDWGQKRFGPTLYKLSFGDYTEKVWKTDPAKISEKFASEKIQGFNFLNLIRKLFKIGGQITEPYYQTWLYHRRGSAEIYRKLASEVQRLGGKILLETTVKAIQTDGRRVKSLVLESDGQTRTQPCSGLLSSIQLPQLISLIGGEAEFLIRYSASKLGYISLILVYIELDLERAGDNHWFYLLDKEFKVNRVTEQKNLSPYTIAPGKTVLSFEISCRQGDELWKTSDQDLVQMVKNDLAKIHFLKDCPGKITDALVVRVPDAYEAYYKDFDRHAEYVFAYLNQFENLVSFGRRGLFLQGDMHMSMEMGLELARLMDENRPRPASPNEYYKKYVRYIDL